MPETFYRLAQSFEMIAIALDDARNVEDRKDLLGRMKAVIDEIDEALRLEALDPKPKSPTQFHADHELERLLKSASKIQTTVVP
jgi:hypothetical protein